MDKMPRVINSRSSWDVDNKVGAIQVLVTPDNATAPVNTVNFPGLDAASFGAMMVLLGSGDTIFYNPGAKTLFSLQ
jgi:hypothetical protein